MKTIIGITLIAIIALAGCSAPARPFGSASETVTPTVYNVTLTDNSTQYSQLLPDGTRKLSFTCRDGTTFRYAFVSGKVAGPTAPYRTCPANVTITEDGILTNDLTLYLAGAISGKVIEITCWK